MDTIHADFFDGLTARRHAVELQVGADTLTVQCGEATLRTTPKHAIRVEPRLAGAPRRLSFADGAVAVSTDHDAIDRVFGLSPVHGLAHRLESHVGFVIVSLAGVIALGVWGYVSGVPWAAQQVAMHIPPSIEGQLSRKALESLDQIAFKPTTLEPERQAAISRDFATLREAAGLPKDVRLEFREGAWVRANALALPGGVVVVTDELVEAMPNDKAVAAVLSHELGHVFHRHVLRHLLQDSITALGSMAVFGDASGVAAIAASAPLLMMKMAHSRDFERESDQFAFSLLARTGRSPEDFAVALEALEASVQARREVANRNRQPREPGFPGRLSTDYLSTHPAIAERIAEARAAAKR